MRSSQNTRTAPLCLCRAGRNSRVSPTKCLIQFATPPAFSGYGGDGISCSFCPLEVSVQTSFDGTAAPTATASTLYATIVVPTSLQNNASQAAGACVSGGGLRLSWTGVGVGPGGERVAVPLDNPTNGARTAALRLPAGVLASGTTYAFTLRACYALAPASAECAAATVGFAAQSAPLAAGALSGGHAVVSDRRSVVLDASAAAVSPDGSAPGDLTYAWACATSTGGACLTPTGEPFVFAPPAPTGAGSVGGTPGGTPPPPAGLDPVQALLLAGGQPVADGFPGAPGGINYVISVTVSKGSESTTTTTELRVFSANLPSAQLLPLARPKALPLAALRLTGQVAPAEGEAAARVSWAQVSGPSSASLSWDSEALSGPANVTLSIGEGSLLPGGTYVFRLTASGAAGNSSADITVAVAAPPAAATDATTPVAGVSPGRVEVSPASGVAVTTPFTVRATQWANTDGPLQYQVRDLTIDPLLPYASFLSTPITRATKPFSNSSTSLSPSLSHRICSSLQFAFIVPGENGTAQVFQDYSLSPSADLNLPWIVDASGVLTVSVVCTVKNAYGLTAEAAPVTVAVEWPILQTSETQEEFLSGAALTAQAEILRGRPSSAIAAVIGITSLVNTLSTNPDVITGANRQFPPPPPGAAGQPAAPPVQTSVVERERIREALLGLIADSAVVAPPTAQNLQLQARAVAAVVAAPTELTPAAQRAAVSVLARIVSAAAVVSAGPVTGPGGGSGAAGGSGSADEVLTASIAEEIVQSLSRIAIGALPSLSAEARVPPPPPRELFPPLPRGAPQRPRPPPPPLRPSPPPRVLPPPGANPSAVSADLFANITAILDTIRDVQIRKEIAAADAAAASPGGAPAPVGGGSERQPVVFSSDTINLQIQIDDTSNSASRLFTQGLSVPGSEARFQPLPAAVATALGGGRVVTELLSLVFNPYQIDPEEAAAMGGITRLRFLDPVTGLELNVSGLPLPVLFSIPSPPSLAVAQASGRAVKAECRFWDPSIKRFSSKGCAAAPNPRPPGMSVFWPPGMSTMERTMDAETLSVGWASTGADDLLSGCERRVLDCGQINAARRAAAAARGTAAAATAAALPAATGEVVFLSEDPFSEPGAACPPDATGKFLFFASVNGSQCLAWSPNNPYGCAWDLPRQAWVGNDCEVQPTVQCGAF